MPTADLTLKRHDTWPALKATLEQTDPLTGRLIPVNLTGAERVTLLMKSANTPPIEGLCTLVDEKGGKVEYEWEPGTTSIAGTYQAEFEIEWGPGKIETIPNDSYNTIVIAADLGLG